MALANNLRALFVTATSAETVYEDLCLWLSRTVSELYVLRGAPVMLVTNTDIYLRLYHDVSPAVYGAVAEHWESGQFVQRLEQEGVRARCVSGDPWQEDVYEFAVSLQHEEDKQEEKKEQ